MKRYWAMKTYTEWWEAFCENSIIGIGQEDIDQSFNDYTDIQIEELITNGLTESIERNFRQFCQWMNPGDFVIIGTGQTTKFNISGIVKVESDYRFTDDLEPRHIRSVKIIKIFDQPKPLQRFARVARLELIDELDFHESIISLIE